jgi:cholesterol transport system auxiliary component
MIKAFARIRDCLLVLLLTMFTACMGSAKPPSPIYYYTLDYPPPAVRLEHQLPCTLRVERFSVSPPFNSQHMIYARDNLQRNAYAYQQWVVAPGDLLPYFLARDLRQTNAFRAVLPPDTPLAATHSLYGWVEQFVEQDTSPHWQASVIIHVTLISDLDQDPTRRILLQKRYSAAAPCKEKTPEALAEAMSTAVSEISQAVINDIHDRLSNVEPLNY